MLKVHEWRRCTLLLLLFISFSACHTAKRTVSTSHKNTPQTSRINTAPREENIRDRYAGIMRISPSDLRNLELYHFIDHWYSAPYKWGGNDEHGVDCSGFVWTLYREVYRKKIARNSEQIFLTNCEEQPVRKLREGDLVFFKVGGQKIDHVGLYLHNDFFVHATSSRGVVIDRLTDEYWAKRLFKAGVVREN